MESVQNTESNACNALHENVLPFSKKLQKKNEIDKHEDVWDGEKKKIEGRNASRPSRRREEKGERVNNMGAPKWNELIMKSKRKLGWSLREK